MTRLKVLMMTYACEPRGGSEAGIGWNIATAMGRYHDVWVVTRTKRRVAIEAECGANPAPGLHFVYFDFPSWVRRLLGVQLYYYLWLAAVSRMCARLHRRERFDLAHHVTLGRYWTWSPLAWLGIPFVWGPLGGGESAPRAFLWSVGFRGACGEVARSAARWLGEHDLLLRRAIALCSRALAATPETELRLRKLGADRISLLGHVALNDDDLLSLTRFPAPASDPVRFVSMGRLLHWKGFHLGIEAFARAAIPGAEYWIVGDGPDSRRLRALARKLGLTDRVRLWGALPRTSALEKLGQCHVLLHPSLHDSGGWVCAEAMAAGRPVICLGLGGPVLVTADEAGIGVDARDPQQAVGDLAKAMATLALDREKRERMGEAGRARVKLLLTWKHKASVIDEQYREILLSRRESA